jgi:hypothetical protein
MKLHTVLLLAGLVAVANARCANDCSGHGTCGANDRCTCYSAWQAADCSERSCPYGNAWVDTASATNTAHNYAECSNRGACDRKTGLCACADGYDGMACARTTCPNDCSGHGTCETIAELATDESKAVMGKSYATSSSWDATKTRGCKCDPKYTGHDCSSRMCPKGDDPLTTEVDITQTETTSLQVDEVQNVTVQSVNAPINSGEVTFTYTDLYNGVWTTRPVSLPLVKTWINKNSKLKTQQFEWVTTTKHITAAAGQAVLDATTGEYYNELTLNSAPTAAQAAKWFRKGDWLRIAKAADGTELCMCNVFADVGAATALKCKKPTDQGLDTVKLCKVSAFSAGGSLVYAAWDEANSGAALDGPTKGATSYVSSTGIITIDATGTYDQATTDATASPLSEFIPGAWIRLFDDGDATGEFCDFQINALPTSNTEIRVNAASGTSTKVDASTGVGNAGGSVACNDFTAKTYGVAIIRNGRSLFAKTSTTQPFHHMSTSGDKWTMTTYNSVTTFTRLLADGTTVSPFTALERDTVQAGALLNFYVDASSSGAGNLRHYCVCRISSYVSDAATNTLQCVAPGSIAGSTALTSCTAATAISSARFGGMHVQSINGIFFEPGSDDSVTNPNYFTGLQGGDQVALTNLNHFGRDSALTFSVAGVDPTLGRAIYFEVGSAPKGGGMYPIVPVSGAITSAKVAVASVALSVPAIVQAVYTGGCASSWCATDAATSNSAKDVARVLEELPNQVLDGVQVSMTSNALGMYAYSVTFAGARNSGNQHEVVMNGNGCSVDGCQPRYSGVRTQTSFSSSTVYASTSAITVESGTMLTSEGMASGGGEDIVLYSAEGNTGKKYSTVAVTDTVATLQYATATTWLVGAKSHAGVLILKATGEYGTGGGGVSTGTTHQIHKFKSVTAEITRGTKESAECSGRGNCDGETGLCVCTEGYTGEACATQTVLV